MTEKAYFALGCFWGPQEYFSGLPGVVKTQVGYSGGQKDNPAYENLGDHTETVEIEFDPVKLSYRDLLAHFFRQHDPAGKSKRQYRSAIFYVGETQRAAAEAAKIEAEKNIGHAVATALEPFNKFFRAEEYHQDYFRKKGISGANLC